MITSRRTAILTVSSLCLGLAFSASAQDTSVLNYFPRVGETPPCISRDPANRGGFERTTTARCYSTPTTTFTAFFVAKGDDPEGDMGTWGGETWFLDGDGWIKDLEESGWCDGVSVKEGCVQGSHQQTFYRAFRDTATSRKGFNWLPSHFSGSSMTYDVDPYVEEYWTDSQGRPTCWGVMHARTEPGTVTNGRVRKVTLSAFLEDRRGTTPPYPIYDVEAILQTFYWDAYTESHWYGRFWDPTAGRYVGLGQVNFELRNGSGILETARAKLMYLVPCSPRLACYTCPDP